MNTMEQPGVVVVCDLQGRIQQVIHKDLAFAAQSAIGVHFTRLADVEDREKAQRFLEAIQSKGLVFDWEINALLENMLVSLHWAGCRGSDGVIIMVSRTRWGLVFLIDELQRGDSPYSKTVKALAVEAARLVKERANQDAKYFDELSRLNNELAALQRELAKQNAELARLDQLKNRFLGMTAHDLRKPIGVIMTYTEFVLDEAGAALFAEQRQFLQTCLNAATGMKRLIDDFLDVAVIESGKLRLDLAPTTAAEIVAGAVEVGRLAAAKKRVSLLVEPPDPKRRLTADGSKLQQVLLNLVGNAVEHSHPEKRVWLSSRWSEHELLLAVRDEGPGLTQEDQARLFVPFAQAGTRKTAGERSTGLGLQIARKIIEAHRGRLWVESVPGQGAIFFAAVPETGASDADSL